MTSKLFYIAKTLVEATFSTFGLRGFYEQPTYSVRETLGPRVEIRDYGPRVAVETTAAGLNWNQASNTAFSRLFSYIAGENSGKRRLPMTVTVQQTGRLSNGGRLIAMTTPVQTQSSDDRSVTMRFFLPKAVIQEGAPSPSDVNVRIVSLPPITLATLRFSGVLNDEARNGRMDELLRALARSQWEPKNRPFVLSYDPPFTVPFLRRNEVAVEVSRR